MKKWLAIILAVCLLATALPIGMLASAATATWVIVDGDDNPDNDVALAVGAVLPAGSSIRNTLWDGETVKDSSTTCQLLINGSGGMTTNGVFKWKAGLRVDALTPKLTLTGIYKINFVTDGGTLSNTDEYTVAGKEKFPTNLPTASKDGYDFLGWLYDGNLVKSTTTVSPYEYGSTVKLTASYKASGNTTGEDTWSLSGTVLTISGNGTMADYPKSDAPWGTTITKVIIGEGVKNIGANAFANSKNLTEVEISSTVANINTVHDAETNTSAFRGCTGITKFTVASGNTKFASEDGVLYNKAKTTLILCPPAKTGSYTIASTATAIADFAFEGSKLTSISMPAGMKTFGLGAFSECNNITSIEIPAGVTSTTSYVLYNCAKLETLYLHKEFKTVGAMFAFGSPIKTVYYTGTSANASSMTIGGWANITTATKDNVNPNATITWNYNWSPTPAGNTSVSGTVKSFGTATDEITVSIYAGTSTTALKTVKVKGLSASYTLADIPAGTYKVKFEKTKHVAHTYEISVSGTAVTLDAQINRFGDINGDGYTDKKDANLYKKHISRASLLKDYQFEVANINGDGYVDKKDSNLVKKHINRSTLLY